MKTVEIKIKFDTEYELIPKVIKNKLKKQIEEAYGKVTEITYEEQEKDG